MIPGSVRTIGRRAVVFTVLVLAASPGQGRGADARPVSVAAGATTDNAPTLPQSPGGNPAATNVVTGTGQLGEWLGVDRNGFRLGGLNISDANGQLTGGNAPAGGPATA